MILYVVANETNNDRPNMKNQGTVIVVGHKRNMEKERLMMTLQTVINGSNS